MSIGAEVVPLGTPLGTIAFYHKIAPCLQFASAPELGPRQSLRHNPFSSQNRPLPSTCLGADTLASAGASAQSIFFTICICAESARFIWPRHKPRHNHWMIVSFLLFSPGGRYRSVSLGRDLGRILFELVFCKFDPLPLRI
jgi:hypothetical protein